MTSGSTLHDVAALAGVSPRTVSRVVNDEGGFGEATRQRVLDAIERVGYRPNLLARALITRRTATIGLVVPNMVDPFFAELAEGVQAAARVSGRTMFIASHGGELAALNEILSRLASFAVDGVIAFLPLGDRSAIVNHASQGLRIVVVDLPTTGRNIGSVTSELARGAELAVAHLVERGRRSIVMIANQDSLLSAHPPRRESGFRHGLHVAGLPHREEALFRVLPTVEGGRVAMEALLDRCPDLDAVFTYNDFMAIGALQALVSAGRRVPDDVALVGFDDIAICSALVPALTSVRLDRARIGREAVAILDRLAEQTDGPGPAVTIEVELIVRESS